MHESYTHVCGVGTVGKISDYQPEGPGFNPQPGRGLNFEATFFCHTETWPTLDLKNNIKSEISLRYSKGNKLSSISLSLYVKFLG